MRGVRFGVALLLGCGGTTDGSVSDSEDGSCIVNPATVELHPLDGAGDAFFRTVVDATFLQPSLQGELSVADAQGQPVPGSAERVDERMVFVADAPFELGETYTTTLVLDASIAGDCEPLVATWTVANGVGSSVDVGLTPGVYKMDLRQGRFAAPPGLGELVQDRVEVDLLLGVEVDESDQLVFSATAANQAGEQDLCQPVAAFDNAPDFSENPFWSVADDGLPLVILGDRINVTQLRLSGAFVPEGDVISGVAFQGIMDTRDLGPGAGFTWEPGELTPCEVFGSFGVTCVACDSDGDASCIPMLIDSLELEKQPYDLVPVDEQAIEDNEAC